MKNHMMKCGVDLKDQWKAETEEMDRDFPIAHLESYFSDSFTFSNRSIPLRDNGFAPDYLIYAALYNSTDGVLREPVNVLEIYIAFHNLDLKAYIKRLIESFDYPTKYLYFFKYVKSYVKA